MNFIDKILGVLKKRGAKAPPGEPAKQAANTSKNRIQAALIGVVVLVLAGAAGWYWWMSRQKAAPAVKEAQPTKPISAPQGVPPPVETPNVASGEGISQSVAESPPVAVAVQEAAPKENEPKASEHEKEAATSAGQEPEVPPPAKVHDGHPAAAPKAKGRNESEHGPEVVTLSPSPESEVPPAKVHNKHPAATNKQHNRVISIPAPDTKNAGPGDEPGASSVREGGVNKKVKPLSLQQQADNEFRRANGLMQQGKIDEALTGYEAALHLDPGHEAARQATVALLLQSNRNADAESVLQDGLKLNIKHSGFAMLLARIQIDRDASWSALLTLQKTLPYAERQADYQAFVAALLQRLDRHKEAVAHYQAAVQIAPNSGVWWMGMGISMKALQRNEEARAAFKRALDTRTLNADLQNFVSQQMKAL